MFFSDKPPDRLSNPKWSVLYTHVYVNVNIYKITTINKLNSLLHVYTCMHMYKHITKIMNEEVINLKRSGGT